MLLDNTPCARLLHNLSNISVFVPIRTDVGVRASRHYRTLVFLSAGGLPLDNPKCPKIAGQKFVYSSWIPRHHRHYRNLSLNDFFLFRTKPDILEFSHFLQNNFKSSKNVHISAEIGRYHSTRRKFGFLARACPPTFVQCLYFVTWKSRSIYSGIIYERAEIGHGFRISIWEHRPTRLRHSNSVNFNCLHILERIRQNCQNLWNDSSFVSKNLQFQHENF